MLFYWNVIDHKCNVNLRNAILYRLLYLHTCAGVGNERIVVSPMAPEEEFLEMGFVAGEF